MLLNRTEDGPSSSAASLIRWSNAALLTPYAPNQRWVLVDAIDEMPTNDPPPPRTISRPACLIRYIVPLTFRSTVWRHNSESIWVIGPMVSDPPALCTTPCSRPCQAVAASTARRTSSSLVTSAGSVGPPPPADPAVNLP